MIAKTITFVVGAVLFLAAPFIIQTLRTPEESDTGRQIETLYAESAVPASGPTLPMMTREQFGRILPGMTYDECISIAGSVGAEANANRWGASGITAALTWYDPDGRTEFTFGFRDGRVAGKNMGATRKANARAARRLRELEARIKVINIAEARRYEKRAQRSGEPIVITVAEFERIRMGITYEECVAIIGFEISAAKPYTAQRNAALRGNQTLEESYRWPNPGDYFAQITFHNGRVSAKTWKHGPPATQRRSSQRGSS